MGAQYFFIFWGDEQSSYHTTTPNRNYEQQYKDKSEAETAIAHRRRTLMSHENIPERDVKPGGTRVRQGRQWGEAGLRGGAGEGTRLGQHVYVMAAILRVADGRGAYAAGASKEGAGERAYNVQCKRSARQRGQRKFA